MIIGKDRNSNIVELTKNLESAESILRNKRCFAEADAVNFMKRLAVNIAYEYIDYKNDTEEDKKDGRY